MGKISVRNQLEKQEQVKALRTQETDQEKVTLPKLRSIPRSAHKQKILRGPESKGWKKKKKCVQSEAS